MPELHTHPPYGGTNVELLMDKSEKCDDSTISLRLFFLGPFFPSSLDSLFLWGVSREIKLESFDVNQMRG